MALRKLELKVKLAFLCSLEYPVRYPSLILMPIFILVIDSGNISLTNYILHVVHFTPIDFFELHFRVIRNRRFLSRWGLNANLNCCRLEGHVVLEPYFEIQVLLGVGQVKTSFLQACS